MAPMLLRTDLHSTHGTHMPLRCLQRINAAFSGITGGQGLMR
jgi:hypothetical protein